MRNLFYITIVLFRTAVRGAQVEKHSARRNKKRKELTQNFGYWTPLSFVDQLLDEGVTAQQRLAGWTRRETTSPSRRARVRTVGGRWCCFTLFTDILLLLRKPRDSSSWCLVSLWDPWQDCIVFVRTVLFKPSSLTRGCPSVSCQKSRPN
jgi:hypothetical protein